MHCTDPRTVGFKADGKTITWSSRQRSKEYAPFQLPCGQCLECRLAYAREWAIRCVHEAQMHEKNSFITLTYSDEHLKSPKLIYSDFQKFMKRIRKTQNEPIGVFVTGEYGERTKRPHWHALLFNWVPRDGKPKYKNERGDQVYESKLLSETWGQGTAEYGSVTMESASYCARYAAKKLVHGKDQEHEFHPISKKSSKHAIGKKWLEKYWQTDVFNNGYIIHEGNKLPIPRYYEKWLKENQPEFWLRYVTSTKQQKMNMAALRAAKEQELWLYNLHERRNLGKPSPLKAHVKRSRILKSKFKLLQDYLKL